MRRRRHRSSGSSSGSVAGLVALAAALPAGPSAAAACTALPCTAAASLWSPARRQPDAQRVAGVHGDPQLLAGGHGVELLAVMHLMDVTLQCVSGGVFRQRPRSCTAAALLSRGCRSVDVAAPTQDAGGCSSAINCYTPTQTTFDPRSPSTSTAHQVMEHGKEVMYRQTLRN